MIKISTPTLAVNRATTNLFYYQNTTSQIQVIRVDQTSPQRFEKVVFPGEQLLFHATPAAFLTVCTRTTTGLTLVNQIPCAQLQVLETEI